MSIPNRKVDPNEVRYGQLGTIIPSYTYTYMGLKTNVLLIQNNCNIHVHMVDRTNLHLVLSLEVDVNMLYGIHHHIYHIGVTENRKMNQSLYGTHHHIEVYIA